MPIFHFLQNTFSFFEKFIIFTFDWQFLAKVKPNFDAGGPGRGRPAGKILEFLFPFVRNWRFFGKFSLFLYFLLFCPPRRRNFFSTVATSLPRGHIVSNFLKLPQIMVLLIGKWEFL